MKTTIKIESLEGKKSKAGKKYVKVTDNHGKAHSAFEDDIMTALAKNLYGYVEVEIEESNGFSNIRKFYGTGNKEDAEVVTEKLSPRDNENKTKTGPKVSSEKLASMLTSYAKDLCCSIIEQKNLDIGKIIGVMEICTQSVLNNYAKICEVLDS